MAYYHDQKRVTHTEKETAIQKYKKLWKPGQEPTYPGIYKCQTCGFEDVINRECKSLPPCSNCDSKNIEWKLLVRASNK